MNISGSEPWLVLRKRPLPHLEDRIPLRNRPPLTDLTPPFTDLAATGATSGGSTAVPRGDAAVMERPSVRPSVLVAPIKQGDV